MTRLILGAEILESLDVGSIRSAKMVLNERGAILFGVSREHREMKAEGISYEDNYRGNALAAMLAPGLVEIRYHAGFTDGAVERLIANLLAREELSRMSEWRVTYQGRPIRRW